MNWGWRVIGISGSIWSKTLMELIFNPCGEFWWSSEGTVSQIHSAHLHVGVPGIFSELLMSKERVGRGKQREATAPILSLVKHAALVLEFAMELIFKPYGEFRWSPEGTVIQIHSAHLHVGVPGIFSELLMSKERVGCRKEREATAPILSLVKLHPWFLSLRWKICLRQNCSQSSCTWSEGPALGQNTLMMMVQGFTFEGCRGTKW